MFCRITLFITTVLLGFSPLVVGQQAVEPTDPSCAFQGWTENGIYHNPQFRLSYRLPDGWVAAAPHTVSKAAAPTHRFMVIDLNAVREAHWLECSLFKAFDPHDSRNNIALAILDFAGDIEGSEQEIATAYLRFMETEGVKVLHGVAYSDGTRSFFSLDFDNEHRHGTARYRLDRSPYTAIVVTKTERLALVWYLHAESDEALHKLLDTVHSAFSR